MYGAAGSSLPATKTSAAAESITVFSHSTALLASLSNTLAFTMTLPFLTVRFSTRVTLSCLRLAAGPSSAAKYWLMPLVMRMSVVDLAKP